jgi:hypothetical protein
MFVAMVNSLYQHYVLSAVKGASNTGDFGAAPTLIFFL